VVGLLLYPGRLAAYRHKPGRREHRPGRSGGRRAGHVRHPWAHHDRFSVSFGAAPLAA